MLLSGLSLLAFGSFNHTRYSYTPIRVACVGDSITEGSGYPDDLQKILGRDYAVANFGVSGSTVQLHSDRPYVYQTAYRLAQMYNPEIIVIMLGTNDARQNSQESIENFTANYERMVLKLQELRSAPDIWLVEPPPILNNTLGLSEENLLSNVIPGIRQAASNLGLPTINVHLVLNDSSEYFYDGVHPNNKGAQLIAQHVGQTIISDTAQPEYSDFQFSDDA